MQRYYYQDTVSDFLAKDPVRIFGEITSGDPFSSDELQKKAWKEEITILQRELSPFDEGHVIFEYTIPRVGKRIDVVFIYRSVVFLLEFKVGERTIPRHAWDQVVDYALDLQAFHEESHHTLLAPMLICTQLEESLQGEHPVQMDILAPYVDNGTRIGAYIRQVTQAYDDRPKIDGWRWIRSIYKPTPTIIEAARVLYQGHGVEDISRNDASAKNLQETSQAINRIIDGSKANGSKSICFITGVPGAGKTLAGLNIAVSRQRIDADEHAVFLSGNGPLVEVLQEALARDEVRRVGGTKEAAKRKAKEFIQLIHHFRDEAITTEDAAPVERVVVFDEAQRAWDESQLTKFMREKKSKPDFDMSEPEFLISIMNRHQGWATIICLVGGGQEINTGESAGIAGWIDALREHYPDWHVYISNRIVDAEYTQGKSIEALLAGVNSQVEKELHLGVSLRSFRSENVAAFVKALLDVDRQRAKALYATFADDYPIVVTRDLKVAQQWACHHAKGTRRYGQIASSGAKRLRKYGIWVQNKIRPAHWFLDDKDDVRSSWCLEETATEFDIQGLELDWTIVGWDADLRFAQEKFSFYQFRGSQWQNIGKSESRLYLKNAYRVLLTRARQGMVIFVPKGDPNDVTALPRYYDELYKYLKDIGMKEAEII